MVAGGGDTNNQARGQANNLRNPCRAHVILAQNAPTGVILRRGPSAWVQLILWHTDTDRLEYGQWFRGRVYERRCHLSPDGMLLIYFANKIGARTIRSRRSCVSCSTSFGETKHAWR